MLVVLPKLRVIEKSIFYMVDKRTKEIVKSTKDYMIKSLSSMVVQEQQV